MATFESIRRTRQQNMTMVVDDDLYVRQLVRRGLAGLTELVEVGNGLEVLSTYENVAPNIVFLDIHLPHVSGMDLVERLMDMDAQAHIIMLSADAARDNVLGCLSKGAKGFIAKPFSKATLLREFNRCPTIKFCDEALSATEAPNIYATR